MRARAIFGFLPAVLAAVLAAGPFTSSAFAQLDPASLTSADGRFTVLAGRSNVLQDAGLTSLTAQDIQIIIENEAAGNPRVLTSLADDPEARKAVLENLKQALAVASEARRTGFAADESIKMQLALAREEELALAYDDNLKAKAGSIGGQNAPFNYIADKDVEAFFGSPANKKKYAEDQETFLKFIDRQQIKVGAAAPAMSEEQKQFALAQWKKVTYGALKARELHLDDKKVDLLAKLQQVLILARLFSKEKLKAELTPTGDEIKAYMTANARFSKEPMRARAEAILAKLGAGSDFAALANEFSEDPGNKDQTGKSLGGLYDWNNRDVYVKEFSDAAWALNAGQTSRIVETQFGYHILKLEDKRVQKDPGSKDEEQIKVRHILISTMYKEEPGPDPAGGKTVQIEAPMVTMEEGARKELGKQKQARVIEGILARNPITLPDDFHIVAPAETGAGPAAAKTASATKKAPAAAKKAAARKSVKKGKARYSKKKP
ncbi:MAG TPA: peptidylprolyl isomerase [Pyrinomonadaceae bacterium]|nr:peptidylprolyl isomerase [Pyrinomonadaceae bacterium]